MFLSDLAVTATRAANTSITDTNARRSISQTDDFLVADGQLTIKPQPSDVLDALASHHLLVRTGEPLRYRFQHQQFQEWSHPTMSSALCSRAPATRTRCRS